MVIQGLESLCKAGAQGRDTPPALAWDVTAGKQDTCLSFS